jgi:hypothetical protein
MSSVRLSEIIRDPDKLPNQPALQYISILDDVVFSEVATIINKAREDIVRADITLPEKLASEIQSQLNYRVVNMRDSNDNIIVLTTIYKDSLKWNSSISYETIMPERDVQINTRDPKIQLQITGTINLRLILKEDPGNSKIYILRGKLISGQVNKCYYDGEWI